MIHSIKDWLKVLVPAFLLLGSLGGGLYLLAKFLRSWSGESDAQSVDLERSVRRPRAKVGKPLNRDRVSIRVDAQAIPLRFDLTALPDIPADCFHNLKGVSNVIAKIYRKYQFILYLVEEQSGGKINYKRLGHLINLRDQYFIGPFHYIPTLSEYSLANPKAEVFMMTANRKTIYRSTISDFIKNFYATTVSVENDMCIVKLTMSHRKSCGILDYVITDQDLSTLRRSSTVKSSLIGTMYTDLDSGCIALRTQTVYAKHESEPLVVRGTWDMDDPYYAIEETMSYETPMTNGDCGSLLVTDEANFSNRVIYGMHVAGDKQRGYSTVLTQELLRSILETNELKVSDFVEEEHEWVIYDPDIPSPQGTLVADGFLKAGKFPVAIYSTEIRRSKFFEMLGKKTTAPARLRDYVTPDGDLVSPSLNALKRYGGYSACIPEENITAAKLSYMEVLDSLHYLYSRDIIPLEEALHSFRSVKPIASSTSAGYPMNVNGVPNVKKEYYAALASGEDASEAFEKIKVLTEEAIEKMRKGIRPSFLYTGNLKDERVKLEKVKEGKTRMFSGSPFTLLVLFRQYFGAFIDFFFEKNLEIGSAIAVNPYSKQWDSLVRKLKAKGGTIEKILAGAGDFKAMDCSELVSILNAILDLIQAWYGNTFCEAHHIREMLWMEITNSKQVFNGRFYEWSSSLPSGNPMTAIINTMYVQMVYRLAWATALLDVRLFNKYVYLVALGDDSLYSVHPEYQEFFNEIKMPELMARNGLTYTTETKEGECTVPFRPITEVSFLKRGFVYNRKHGRWIAPLDITVLYEMQNWTKKGLIGSQISADNIGTAIMDLALHGKEEFQKGYTVLMGLLREKLPNYKSSVEVYSDYDEALDAVLQVEYEF